MDSIVKNPYNHLLYKTSYLTLIAISYSIYNQKIKYAISSGSIFCTSLLYWKNPTLGIRRNIDIMVVNIVYVYHSYNSFGIKYAREHYFWTYLAIFCYILSWHFQYKNQFLEATLLHSLLHVFANIGHIYLVLE